MCVCVCETHTTDVLLQLRQTGRTLIAHLNKVYNILEWPVPVAARSKA